MGPTDERGRTWRIQKSLNQQKSFCIFRKKKKKKILQLGEIVFWIEHSIVLVFPFSVFFEGVLFFRFPNRMSFFEINDHRR